MGTNASVDKGSKKHTEALQEIASDECVEETASVLFCDPCNSAGEENEAVGYCVDCKECLCSICYKSHSRNKLSRSHVLLNRDAIPGEFAKLCDSCKVVNDENEAEGFCGDCKEYLCAECFQGHARNKLSRHHIMYSKHNMPRPITGNFQEREKIKEESTYNEEYRLVSSLNVIMKPEEQNSYITGIALVSDHQVVMTDELNRSLKLYDKKEHHIWSVKMESVPNRITSISHDQVAVVLRNECKIKIYSIPKLETIRSLKTDGTCVDIECVKTKLFVSFRKPLKFQVLDLTGKIKSTILPDDAITGNCDSPSRIAVYHDESLIFISDWKRKTLMSMDMDGKMVSLFPTPLSWCERWRFMSACGLP
ncbi:uncharacterized protein LOC132758568 [Ruditapes philippinarum]|uniref:uncharacterized protein LOC132758568 n=1 Tax=Ruditapes philippinarum TaxID=129788 RepID=UPI00295A895D|nr:uncharacterized protein LOC132758568 [Ruditapes philippinarum]